MHSVVRSCIALSHRLDGQVRVVQLALFTFVLLAVGFQIPLALAQSSYNPVTAADVIAMSQAGLSDQIITAKIHAHNKPADLTTDALVELKKAKVSDAVIPALIDPAATPQPATYCFLTEPATTSSYAGAAGTTTSSNLFNFGLDND